MYPFIIIPMALLVGLHLVNAAAIPTVNPPPSVAPCAQASASWKAQRQATGPAVVSVMLPASLAYDCLRSAPLRKSAAIALVDAIEPYLEFQSNTAYLADPPSTYQFPAVDVYANLAAIKSRLQNDGYASEYVFQQDLFFSVFAGAHDGHFIFAPDLMSRVFAFGRPFSLVSISRDGTALPEIKLYEDVASANSSAVVSIDGVDAARYVETLANASLASHDADAAYNSMFFSLASHAATDGGRDLGHQGFFKTGGTFSFTYPGPNTTLTFANGSQVTRENFAVVKSSLVGVTDGVSLYDKFCVSGGMPLRLSHDAPEPPPWRDYGHGRFLGYPTPVIATNDSALAGYYLTGDGLDDVAVISVLSFSPSKPSEFQAVLASFLDKAVKAGKTRLVVDLQANAGGFVFVGYDFFHQLFPTIEQDGLSRIKTGPLFMDMARIYSDELRGFDPTKVDGLNVSEAAMLEDHFTFFNFRADVNETKGRFLRFEDKFTQSGTSYTATLRHDFDNPVLERHLGFKPMAKGNGTARQPFDAERMVVVLDGWCSSTCSVVAEAFRQQTRVRSVVFGGRGNQGAMQGVGGTRGAQVLPFSFFLDRAQRAMALTGDKERRRRLGRLTDLPLRRSSVALVNVRDQMVRGEEVPAQFLVEEADCRRWYTGGMVGDVEEVWRAAVGCMNSE